MMNLSKIAASTAVLAFFAGTDANAAGENFCNDYAGTSVEQFNRAQELGLPVAAPRWHGAFDLHKIWCRIVSEAAAQHEMDERRGVIDREEGLVSTGEPSSSGSAAEPSLPAPTDDPSSSASASEPPLSTPVEPPSYSGPEDDPGSALSDGGPPLSAPVDEPHSDTTAPPLSAPVGPPSNAGSEGEPGSALSTGGPPLSAPVGRPPSD